MDITTLFKACVQTARLKNKSLPVPDKRRILATKKEKSEQNPESEFNQRTRLICHQLTQLRDLLIDHRTAYMKFGCHLKGYAQKMTDAERDTIDEETDKILAICTQQIIELRKKRRSTTSRQCNEYMDCVLDSLTNYLKGIFSISNQMRTYRMKKELESYKLLKLKADKSAIPEVPKRAKSRKTVLEADDVDDISHSGGPDAVENLNGNRTSYGAEDDEEMGDYSRENVDDEDDDERQSLLRNRLNVSNKMAVDEDNQSSYIEEEETEPLSPEDIQMFEMENKQLFNELKGLSEEVAQIEKNVTEIAKLQDLFTEKVTIQKTDIDRIANAVVGATENVKDANDQIREAIQRNAGLRVWVLFFLLVMSFSLLFLHWYND